MNATTTIEGRLAGYEAEVESAASSEALRLAQYSWLNEMPGLIFGLITIFYLISSLVALI